MLLSLMFPTDTNCTLSQDVIELRERRWIPRNAVAAPTTIAQVHEAVSSSPR
jgi:hypothetical protein